MSDSSEKLLGKINSKLDILIALQMVEEKPNKLKDKIKLLNNLGVESAEIASILGTSVGFVSKERSLLNKEKNSEKENE